MRFSFVVLSFFFFFFFNDTATTEIYTLSLHDALPIYSGCGEEFCQQKCRRHAHLNRSEEHTSELQSLRHLVCRLLLEKKKKTKIIYLKGPQVYNETAASCQLGR